MVQPEVKDASGLNAGGALPLDTSFYIPREADEALLHRLLAGQTSYILAPPQTGKSSLMLRTSRALQERGRRTGIIYLGGLAGSATLEQWLLGLLVRLAFQLKLPLKVETWWQDQAPLEPARRLANFLEQEVLPQLTQPLVIFLDELETLFPLPFSAELLALLQGLDASPEPRPLTWVFLGRPVPVKWLQQRRLIPPERCLDLPDFSREEAQPLAEVLMELSPEEGEMAFNRIFYWSGGHPYLTQRLALSLAQARQGYWSGVGVDRLVERLVTASGEAEEPHLRLIREEVADSPRRRKLQALIRRLSQGQSLPELPESGEQAELKRLGLVRVSEAELQFRNPLYRRLFQPKTERASGPGWLQRLALAVLLLLLLIVAAISLNIYWQQQTLAAEARRLADNFRHASTAEVRLESLAGLIHLPEYRHQARALFYQELSAQDRPLLFELADPPAVGAELLAVIQELYSSPALGNDPRDDELLRAMARPLEGLGERFPGTAINLELEITQWLQGRELQAQGAYAEAIAAYNRALEFNERQPGIYFDRGSAHAALGETELALANFENTLRLDPSWEERVRQVVLEHGGLYTGLWQDQVTYTALAGMMPTPTPTLTAAARAVVAATPSPTPTPTPLPPTPTPTRTATPVPSPTLQDPALFVPPTATPTAAAAPPMALAYVAYEGGGHTLNLAHLADLTLLRTEALVLERGAGPTWSPDGQQIAFVGEVGIEHVLEDAAGGSGIWLYDLATGEPRLLAEIGGLNYLSWSPAGRWIAYESTQDTGQARIFLMDLTGQTRPGHIPGEQPAWSPAGDRIVAKACRPGCGLWVTDLEGGNLYQVSEGGTDSFPHWWGDQIVYATEREGNWDIYRITVDEAGRPLTPPQRLTSDPAQDITPFYAPNGQQLYFRSSRGGQWAIWQMAADGSNPQRLLATGGSEAWARERIAVLAAPVPGQ